MVAFSLAGVKCLTRLKLLVLFEHSEMFSKREKQEEATEGDFETNVRN